MAVNVVCECPQIQKIIMPHPLDFTYARNCNEVIDLLSKTNINDLTTEHGKLMVQSEQIKGGKRMFAPSLATLIFLVREARALFLDCFPKFLFFRQFKYFFLEVQQGIVMEMIFF